MRAGATAGSSRLGDEHRPWLDALEAVGPPPRGLRFPDPPSLPAVFARLGVDERDATEIRANWPSPAHDPDLWWLLERAYHLLIANFGGFDWLAWPSLPATFGATGRFFWAYVFLAAFADVREFHERRGIPEDVSIATLADLGRNLRRDRRLYGEGCLRTHDWLTLHFRGSIYELGRLQFNRMLIRFDEPVTGLRRGDPVVGIHIPESGPLSPDACDHSLRRSREFFARHFPETPVHLGVCTSWLLDPQLAEYLALDSNIVRFQRRFRVVGVGSDGDADIIRFVFKRIAARVEDLPRRTTLERAIVRHLGAGGHWRNRTGWLEL